MAKTYFAMCRNFPVLVKKLSTDLVVVDFMQRIIMYHVLSSIVSCKKSTATKKTESCVIKFNRGSYPPST